ncbi:hypothetical protein AGMMS50267_02940 [Spirochaetia bacterium]|nr:hypothetical protein AGMMS50267_02940 [Spirochaetia bacterium]
MRIAKPFFAVVFFITVSLVVFAQDADFEAYPETFFSETDIRSVPDIDNDPEIVSKLLIRQKSIMFLPFNYQFLDGKPMVERRALRSLLSSVPENRKLLKEEQVWRIVALSCGVIGMGTVAGHSAYLFYDFPNRDTVMTAFYLGEVASLALTFWTAMAANNKIDQAVDRYNISIMGIPIRN